MVASQAIDRRGLVDIELSVAEPRIASDCFEL